MRAEENARLLTPAQRVRVRGDQLTEESVELARWNAGLPALERSVECSHDPVRVPPGLRGKVDAGRPLHLHELALKLALHLLLAVLINEVPLVGDHDEGTARVDDLLDDTHVLLGQRRRAVDEDERHLGLLDGRLGADRRVVVGARRAVHLASDPRRVDKPPLPGVKLDQLVDRIACRSGELVDDNPVPTG